MPVDMKIPVQCLQSIRLSRIDSMMYFVKLHNRRMWKDSNYFQGFEIKKYAFFLLSLI